MSKLTKKVVAPITALLAALSLASCGGSAASKLTAVYTSPATLSYNNFRPNYNYYLTTFSFYTLETYDDNTYILSVSSSTFTAVELPSEGNAAKGNENANYLTRYYGTIQESKVADADLDPNGYVIKISAPTRIVSGYNSEYYIDTDNWNDNMKEKSVDNTYGYDSTTGQQTVTGTKTYNTGAEYLEAKAFEATSINADSSTYKITSISLSFKSAN